MGFEVREEITATVSTNNLTGYTLTMNAISNTTTLTHTNGTNTIPSTNSLTAAALPTNNWGYNKGSGATAFLRIPPLSTPDTLTATSAPITNDITIVTVGAKADINILPGIYSNTLMFTAVGNYVPAPTVTSVTPGAAETSETVIITGTNFYAGGISSAVVSVTIGGTPCISYNVISNTSISCVIPGIPLGNYPIQVITSMGVSNKSVTFNIIERLVPPPGSIPDNITSSNPATVDVYPTTGWEGEVITITGNAIFTDVQSVTIGGIPCTQYDVVTTSAVLCELPANPHGSINNIVVTNNGTNVTNVATYTQMKITYFDPSSSTVTFNVSGTPVTYNYYPNGFTSANCSVLTPSNSTSMNLPNSIVYVRDTRNNQVYKVKRMIDDKCWMIDNMKYIDTSITNYDSTTGMIFRNGVGPNVPPSGGTNAYNTINGTNTQSATNSDKAFFNNPMSSSVCYGGSTTYMAANTLTHCGYLYNWYAATNGTGTYNTSTNGTNVTGGICPANFRLPSMMSGAGGPTTNGTAYTLADFPVLYASMRTGALATGIGTAPVDAVYISNFRPSGPWSGTYSGYWDNALLYQTTHSYYWASTANSATQAEHLHLYMTNYVAIPHPLNKNLGIAVRCVIDP